LHDQPLSHARNTTRLYCTFATNNPLKKPIILNAPPLPGAPSASQLSWTSLWNYSIAGPARAWAVLRARSVKSRFEAMHATGLTALVGREEETQLLLRRWAKAKSDEGQVVLIAGEAGIGKSRLTATLMERLGSEPHTRLR
jgi:transcriptional regulator with AAA-type ATPase domain